MAAADSPNSDQPGGPSAVNDITVTPEQREPLAGLSRIFWTATVVVCALGVVYILAQVGVAFWSSQPLQPDSVEDRLRVWAYIGLNLPLLMGIVATSALFLVGRRLRNAAVVVLAVVALYLYVVQPFARHALHIVLARMLEPSKARSLIYGLHAVGDVVGLLGMLAVGYFIARDVTRKTMTGFLVDGREQ